MLKGDNNKMGLLKNIKQEVQRSGSNKGKLLFPQENQKKRIRFLQEIDQGIEVFFHEDWNRSIKEPCQKTFGRECKYCGDETVRTRPYYGFSVYDYDNNDVKILFYPVNQTTPMTQLVDLAETLGSLTNRDIILNMVGKAQNRSFSVINGEKSVFKNKKAKPFTNKAMLQIIDKAFPAEEVEEEDVEETYGGESDYDDMTAVELYRECIKRGLEVEKKKKAKYYINELIDDDNANEDWGADVVDEGEAPYEDLSPIELFKKCKERGLKAKPKKSADYYIELLIEYDEENKEDEWEEEESEDEWDDVTF